MLIVILFGIFLILHGLVHLLYTGWALRLFELRPGLLWPENTWFFSKLVGGDAARIIVAVMLALVALGLVAGGVGLLLRQGWFRPVTAAAAGLSALIYLLAWDGKMQMLSEKGGIGILIDAAILIVLLIFRWPVL